MLCEVPGGNQAAKGRAVGGGGGKRLFSCGRGAPWCSPPFNGYWGWPGARTCLKPGLGSWNQLSCDTSFCCQGHSGGKAVQHVLIKQALSWKSPELLLSTCSSIFFSSLLFLPLYFGICVCSAPFSGSESLLQFEEYKPTPGGAQIAVMIVCGIDSYPRGVYL